MSNNIKYTIVFILCVSSTIMNVVSWTQSASSLKTPLALAALCFFSPFVHYFLRHMTTDLSEQERSFISWYIRLWYIILVLGIITLGLQISWYILVFNDTVALLTTLCSLLTIISIIIGIFLVISDIPLTSSMVVWWTHASMLIHQGHTHILPVYLPVYNHYLRYRMHNFTTPHRWTKESLLRRVLVMLISFSGYEFLTILILFIVFLRVVMLSIGIDLISLSIKQRLNTLFTKNIEELRWYLLGTVVYLGNYIISSPVSRPDWHTFVNRIKTPYTFLYPLTMPSLITQYIIGILAIGSIYFLVPGIREHRTYRWWLVLLGGRYLMMAIFFRHLPPLPGIREMVEGMLRLSPLLKKFFIHHN